MAYSSLEHISRVGNRITNGDPITAALADAIDKLIPASLQRLGQNVADSPDPATRALLMKSYSLALTSGDVAISTDMVVSAIPKAAISVPNYTELAQFLPFYQDIFSPPNLADFPFFTIHEGKLKFRAYDGSVIAGTVTAYTSFIPTLSNLDTTPELIDDLQDISVALWQESASPMETVRQASAPPNKE